MSRTERPEQIQAPALRSILRMIDMAIENGSLNPQDRDEVIQMFISGPTKVVDNKAGGGMMNINNMIRPVGFANGGDIIIPKKKPSPDIVPKEKPVNFKAIMAEFDTPENRAGPGEPVGIEKIIADQFEIDPRFTMKQRIKEMLGMEEGGGSILDDAADLRILSMKLVLKEAANTLLEMDEIDNMTPIEIESMYNSLIGKKGV